MMTGWALTGDPGRGTEREGGREKGGRGGERKRRKEGRERRRRKDSSMATTGDSNPKFPNKVKQILRTTLH